MEQPRYLVNPGYCALMSLGLPGAGFFLMQKIGLGLGVMFTALTFDILVNLLGLAMMGIGLICTIPLSIVVHVGVSIWTYQAAVAYNTAGGSATAAPPVPPVAPPVTVVGFCEQCGAKLEPGTKFCEGCGAKV